MHLSIYLAVAPIYALHYTYTFTYTYTSTQNCRLRYLFWGLCIWQRQPLVTFTHPALRAS